MVHISYQQSDSRLSILESQSAKFLALLALATLLNASAVGGHLLYAVLFLASLLLSSSQRKPNPRYWWLS